MPTAISAYGIHSGGAQDEEVVCPSNQASWNKDQDFHAKKLQNSMLTKSTNIWRNRSRPQTS